MTDGSDYTDLLGTPSRDLTSITDIAIPKVDGGYNIPFVFLTSNIINKVSDGPYTDYYSGSAYAVAVETGGWFSEVTDQVMYAVRTILKLSAPGATYTADPFSAYFGDVAHITFSEASLDLSDHVVAAITF